MELPRKRLRKAGTSEEPTPEKILEKQIPDEEPAVENIKEKMIANKRRIFEEIENGPMESDSESEEEMLKFMSKKNSSKRVSAPKVAQFNRLVDADLIENDHEGPIQEYEFLRDQQTTFEVNQLTKSMSFEMPRLEKSESLSNSKLLQSAIVAEPTDFLHVHVENSKFIPIKESLNDRSNFLTDLRHQANDRKARTLFTGDIPAFELSHSELQQQVRKLEADEGSDSEGERAQKVMDIIRLEEGEDADYDGDESSDDDADFKPDETQDQPQDYEIPADDDEPAAETQQNDDDDEDSDTQSSSEEVSEVEERPDLSDNEASGDSEVPMDVEEEEQVAATKEVNANSTEQEQLDAISAIMATNQNPIKPPVKVNQARYRAKFIDAEAEEGSDNELHDEVVKHATNSDEEGLVEQDLEGLIDNDQVNTAEDRIQEKHINDEMVQDQLDLKRVIGGKFRERRGLGDYLDEIGTSDDKNAQLISERAMTLAEIQSAGFRKAKKTGSKDDDDEDSESEKLERFQRVQELKTMQKVVKNVTSSSLDLNDESVSYLDMLEHGAINTSRGPRCIALERSTSMSNSQSLKDSFMGKSFVFGREEFLSKNKKTDFVSSISS